MAKIFDAMYQAGPVAIGAFPGWLRICFNFLGPKAPR